MLFPLSRVDSEAWSATKVILPQECFCFHPKTRPLFLLYSHVQLLKAAEGWKRDIFLNGALACHMLIRMCQQTLDKWMYQEGALMWHQPSCSGGKKLSAFARALLSCLYCQFVLFILVHFRWRYCTFYSTNTWHRTQHTVKYLAKSSV